MNHEKNLLASIIQSREAYQKIAGIIDIEGDLSEQGKIIYEGISGYYSRDSDADHCERGNLSNLVCQQIKNEKHRGVFNNLIHEIGTLELSPPNVVQEFLGIRREIAGARLANALASGADQSEVWPLINAYTEVADSGAEGVTTKEILKGVSLREIIDKSYGGDNLISIMPEALNTRIGGGLLRGHHLLIFARPEMGKTLLAMNMVAGFLHQGLTVLYVGNEDPLYDLVIRIQGRLALRTKWDALDEPDVVDKLARERGYENLIFAGLAPGTQREIEELVREYKPDVVVIDQLRNLGMGDENFVTKLEKAATAARNIAKKNGVLVISITQAGESATNKQVLDMSDVDSSKTGIPAQCDVMVGVGASADDIRLGRRVLSLPKNKPGGNHDFFPVKVDVTTSVVRGLEE